MSARLYLQFTCCLSYDTRAFSFNHALTQSKWAANVDSYPNIHTYTLKDAYSICETLAIVLTSEKAIKTRVSELQSQSDKTKARDLTRMQRCYGSV